MTVEQLLAKLADAFPAFNAKALASWAPVFRAKLGRHEGPALQQAYVETLAAFSVATAKSLFPVPANFEPHLPATRVHLPSGPAIDLKAHGTRKSHLIEQWWHHQGNGISEQLGEIVAKSCAYMAAKKAHDLAWRDTPERVVLTAKEIQIAEDQVVSAERMAVYGPASLRREDPSIWQSQMDTIRAAVRAGQSPSKIAKARDEAIPRQSEATTKKLAELAAAKRRAA